ncbi:hypothetical protein [Herminiimonas sp. CN]|uniref:hypothetical protein n=1 Tax=Herminiimonas sp. CN TaxID=1349818 RepID=UPI0012DC3DC6|nr:hypothetical protein [Herminiimonas sp. CN]
MPQDHDEIASFITEETHRLATISMNDYGFQLSARMALSYLERATRVLESKRSRNQEIINALGALKAAAAAIAREYAQLEKFCTDCERFSHQETKNVIEWISKWVVRAISREYMGTASYHLAHKIRTFHSMLCSVLIEG